MIKPLPQLLASTKSFFTTVARPPSPVDIRRSATSPWRRATRSGVLLVGLAVGLSAPAAGQEFELVLDLATGSTQDDLINDVLVGSGVLLGDYTVFQGCTDAFGCEPWRTDGTALGTEMLVDADPGARSGLDFGSFAELDGFAYFVVGFPSQLWRTDGTPEGTEVFVDRVASFGRVWATGGAVWFDGWDEAHGEEPWTTDGTEAGTYRVADLEPGPGDSKPQYFTAVGNRVYFSAETVATGRELYATNGTEAGTYQVADIRAGADDSGPALLSPFGNLLLFRANDGSTGTELWVTDGTGPGTLRLEIRPGPDGSSPTPMGELPGGVFIFSADDGVTGTELWRTNGTVVQPVVDLLLGTSGGVRPGFDWVLHNDLIYFAGSDLTTNGTELFRTDGTAAGTVLVADIFVGGASTPMNLVPVGNTLYYSAWDVTDGRELWATDLSTSATEQITNLDGGDVNSLSSFVTGFPGPGDTLIFPAELDPFGLELWRTDGTAGGTQRLTDIVEPASSRPFNLTPWRGGLAFQPFEGEDAGSLVTTDGTELGTRVLDFPFDQFPVGSMATWQDNVYLAENTVADGSKLWLWNGVIQSLIAEDVDSSTVSLRSTSAGVAFIRSGELSLTDGTVVGDFPSLELVSQPQGTVSQPWYGVDDAWYRVDEQLWRTDLAADTSELLVDLTGDPELSIHEVLGESGGVFYLTIRRTIGGLLDETLICAVDDSPQGYAVVLTFDGDSGMTSVTSSLFTVGGQALLLSDVDSLDWQLHILTGPSAPVAFADGGAGRPDEPAHSDQWLVFETDAGLWRTDGTVGGAELIEQSTDLELHEVFDRWALASGFQVGRGVEFALVELSQGSRVQLPEIQDGPVGTVVGPLVIEDDVLWTSAYRLDVGQELFRLDLAPFLTEPPLFADGFESGDASAWSAIVQ
ncbi:MAG: hypothetical protein AAGM22_19315 [Acidobacteriota bacterium]